MNRILKDKKGQLNVNLAITAILGMILAASFLVIGIVVMQGMTDGSGLAIAHSSGTYTASGTVTANDTVTIGSETYTYTNGVGGAFNVDLGGASSNQTVAVDALILEINANSTLVMAGANVANTTLVTSILTGSQSEYATTESGTNTAWGAATLTDAGDGDDFGNALDDVTTAITSAVVLGGTLLLVIVGVAILMLLASVMYIVRRVQ